MILDHVDMLKLPDEKAKKYNNEFYTLRNLAVGLQYLYRQVDKVEQTLIGSIRGKLKLVTAGNIPNVPKETLALVTCAFHWYAVSACNYVWLVGWLAHQADSNRRKPQKYAHDVIPTIVTYRHKVAAHLATVQPKDDTPADIAATLLFPVTLTDEGFRVGGWKVSTRRKGQACQSKHDFQWNLTKTHVELAERYWPHSLESNIENNAENVS